MAKKYKECMNYMVYRKFETGYVYQAQFDKKEDAELFIDTKIAYCESVNREDIKYELFKNDENFVIVTL